MRRQRVFELLVAGLAVALVASGSARAAEPRDVGPALAADGERASADNLGPVYVRAFGPMAIRPVQLDERCGPVYFRSPFAEPAACDRDVDGNVPLACGAAMADWLMFTFRVLGFPVEMAIALPWRCEPLGR